VSDRGLQFAAELIKELNRILGIETRLSTAFHPQMGGQTEQMNQELEQYLMLWDTLDMNSFYFLFLLFSDFIGILFSFSFLFFSFGR